MRKLILFSAIFFSCYASSQNINKNILEKVWNANWIDVPNTEPHGYGVYHFRKNFTLNEKPQQFIIHVSADNRYKLYVNDSLVSFGPAKGDLYHWNFETVDIASQLHAGKNIVAAVVWNFGEEKPAWQISYRTAFILQGDTKTEEVINTDDSWKCAPDKAYSPLQAELVYSYYAIGATEKVDMNVYPTNWTSLDFNDNDWMNAHEIFNGIPKNVNHWSTGWMLIPRSIPMMELTPQRLQSIRRTNIKADENFLQGNHAIKIPAHTTAHILFDQSFETTAFPVLNFSGGKNADISLTYAEALYKNEPDSIDWRAQNQKGNRNEIEGKHIVGVKDEIISNGDTHQNFTALTFQTYRYVQLDVTTQDDDLTIDDFYGMYTGYPFKMNAQFSSSDTSLNKILEVGWRTARLDAQETYTDCPYYEQLQYVGDTRIQAMVSLYNSGDDRLMRNAIEQIANSTLAEGITESRYPHNIHQEIPTFSLIWISMLHDYYMYRSDTNFVKDQLRISRQVLAFFHKFQQADGSVKNAPYWDFTDWVDASGWDGGVAPIDKDGNSALMDLQLLMAYESGYDLEKNLGMSCYSNAYEQQINQLKKNIRAKYWDADKRLFSDTKEKKYYSQHANALAILTNVVNENDAHALGEKLLNDSSLAKASVYFRYYLYQALTKAGYGNDYLNWLGIWQQNLAEGLTTWAEIDDINRTRSDCHAWGSSPNIELYRIVLGINTDAPGFFKVKIEPHLGALTNASGTMPHPSGNIKASYALQNGKWNIDITLPQTISGRFIWKGKEYMLKSGENKFVLDK
ncbi:MAG TPA: alpha-L-rhamnosidase N-terminal domain-containing protein [Parafilimonas sp.]|nr:alpha-L-rhamnosidase N-terminal domain-containing protein [Parafilimonas sp.]